MLKNNLFGTKKVFFDAKMFFGRLFNFFRHLIIFFFIFVFTTHPYVKRLTNVTIDLVGLCTPTVFSVSSVFERLTAMKNGRKNDDFVCFDFSKTSKTFCRRRFYFLYNYFSFFVFFDFLLNFRAQKYVFKM